mgnify:CR=1 FL=1
MQNTVFLYIKLQDINPLNVKYLDPKNDLTFRKIFGEHPEIMKSFLNSLLPLEPRRYITELSYADPGMIPELPELKHSIVDVRCTDNYNRQFIVEMQMYWTSSFKSRMLFNAGKAHVKQINTRHKYSELKSVYGLSLVDDICITDKNTRIFFTIITGWCIIKFLMNRSKALN